MIEIQIPGFGDVQLAHLVLDYNGTLAEDGRLLEGVGKALRGLSDNLKIHVLTADTFGRTANELDGLPVNLAVMPTTCQAEAKLARVKELGAAGVVAIGNGRNDHKMLEQAAIGIAVMQKEGVAAQALGAADIFAHSILDALDLLQKPRRLRATLRS